MINMNRKIFVILILSVFLISSLQSVRSVELNKNEKTNSNQMFIQKMEASSNPADQAEWTVMVYMCGDNVLEGCATYDLEKIQAATRFDDSELVNIIVMLDKYGKGNTFLYKIEDGAKIDLDDNGTIIPDDNEVNMGDPQTLTKFCNWALESYPANHTFLVLWGNGNRYRYNGHDWFFRTCVDVNNGVDTLNIFDEIRQSLDQITSEGENKIDIIGFDACLMGLLEVAYEIKDCTDYMIASQDTEYIYDVDTSYGWEYLNPMNKLLNNPSYYANNPGELCSEFVGSYPADTSFDELSTLSAIKLDEVDNLASKINNLGEHLYEQSIENRKAVYINSIFYAQDNVKEFRYLWPGGSSGYCGCYADLKHYINLISTKIENDGVEDNYLIEMKDDVNELLEKVVIANNNCSNENVCGLSINMHKPNCSSCRGSSYSRLLFSEYNWDEFVSEFASCWNNNEWPDEPIVTGDSSVKVGDEYELTIKTNDPDGDGLYYEIYWGLDTSDPDAYLYVGPYENNEEFTVTHTFKRSDYNIQDPERGFIIKAFDPWGKSSSTHHYVTLKLTKSKTSSNSLIRILMEKFPILSRIENLFGNTYLLEKLSNLYL